MRQATSSRPPGSNRKASATPFRLRVPQGVDLKPVRERRWWGYALWALHHLATEHLRDRRVGVEDWLPFPTNFITLYVPDAVYRRLLDQLERLELIECDHSYCTAAYAKDGQGKCFFYRLGAKYRGVPLEPRVILNRRLATKLLSTRAKALRGGLLATSARAKRDRTWGGERVPVHRHLGQWLTRVRVDEAVPSGMHEALELIRDGDLFFKADDQGRVYTNVTNLPRADRQHIRVQGHDGRLITSLSSVDVSTCLPLLFSNFLLSLCSTPLRSSQPLTSTTIMSSISTARALQADCLNSVFYEQLARDTGYTRDEVKGYFMAVFNGDPGLPTTRVGKAVDTRYPGVLGHLRDTKLSHDNGWLSREIFRREATIMIEAVAGRMMREHPAVPVFSLHDAIIVPTEFVCTARSIVSDEWFRVTGLRPRLKVSRWS